MSRMYLPNRYGPRFTRAQAAEWWRTHCNACSTRSDELLEIPSNILGPGWYCQLCADQYHLHTAEQRAALQKLNQEVK